MGRGFIDNLIMRLDLSKCKSKTSLLTVKYCSQHRIKFRYELSILRNYSNCEKRSNLDIRQKSLKVIPDPEINWGQGPNTRSKKTDPKLLVNHYCVDSTCSIIVWAGSGNSHIIGIVAT